MEKKYSNLVKTRDFLKDSRMNPKLESKLFKSINKIDIFSTPISFNIESKTKETAVDYIFTIGHNLEDVYENDFSDAALLDFGDMQMIVSSAVDFNPSFELPFSHSGQQWLEKWHKLLLLNFRWTGFDGLLRPLSFEYDDPSLCRILIGLLTSENFIEFLAEEISLHEIFDQHVFTFVLDKFERKHPILQQNHSFRKYCKVTEQIDECFEKGEYLKKYDKKFFYPQNCREKREFAEIYFFAEAILFQIESTFSANAYVDWARKLFLIESPFRFCQEVTKSLYCLIWGDEERKEMLERIKKACRGSNNLAKLDEARECLETRGYFPQILSFESDNPLRRNEYNFRNMQETEMSIFNKISLCLGEGLYLTNILRFLCLAELVNQLKTLRDHQNSDNVNLLVKLIMPADKDFVNQPEADFYGVILDFILEAIS